MIVTLKGLSSSRRSGIWDRENKYSNRQQPQLCQITGFGSPEGDLQRSCFQNVFPTPVGMNRHLSLLVMQGKLLGVHIGVYKPYNWL